MTSEYIHGHEYDTYHYEDSQHNPQHFTVTRPTEHDVVIKGSYYHAHPEQVEMSYPHSYYGHDEGYHHYDDSWSHPSSHYEGYHDEDESNFEWEVPAEYHADSEWYTSHDGGDHHDLHEDHYDHDDHNEDYGEYLWGHDGDYYHGDDYHGYEAREYYDEGFLH